MNTNLVDPQAERIVLGSSFGNSAAWFDHAHDLDPADFYGPGHSEIQGALRHHAENEKPFELVAVGATLRDRGHDDAILAELAECIDAYFDPEDAPQLSFYVDRVRHLAHLRRLKQTLARIPAYLAENELDYGEKIDAIAVEMFSALETRERGALGTAEVLADEVLAIHAERSEARETGDATPSGIPTGIAELDTAMGGGLQPGRFITVGARSGDGKSTFCNDVAYQAAERGHSTLIVALEATGLEVFLSILQKASGITPFKAREGVADPVRLRESLEALRSLPLVIEKRALRSENPFCADPACEGRASC